MENKYFIPDIEELRVRYEWEWIDRTNLSYLYQGECKDINTFRYICKLLKI
jgi:hypothetical protein